MFPRIGKILDLNLMEKDVATHQEHRDIFWQKLLQRIRKILEVSAKRCYNVSEGSWKLLQEDVTTYQEQEDLGSYCKKMLQRVRNILEVWRRCFCKKMLQRIRNIVNLLEEVVASWHLLEEVVTTYQKKHVGSYWRRCYNVSGTSWHLLEEVVVHSIRKILEVTARRCYNMSGTSSKLTSWHLLEEVVTTYQKDVGSDWRRCYRISERSWKLMEEDVTTYQEQH